jgi:hypothetical protein
MPGGSTMARARHLRVLWPLLAAFLSVPVHAQVTGSIVSFTVTNYTGWIIAGDTGSGRQAIQTSTVMLYTNTNNANGYHSLFVTADGHPWAMGQNTDGQLGDGYLNNTNRPVLVDGGRLVTASLAKGPEASHGLAVAGALPVVNGLTNQTVNSGQSFTSSALVTGGDRPFTFQWQLNGNNIAGATNATYSVASPTTSNAGTYTLVVTVTDTGISTSTSFLVTIGTGGPSISGESVQTNGFRLHAVGATNTVYSIVASTNLKNWLVIGIATQTGPASYDFVDTNSYLFPRRFYRIRSP